MHDYLADVSVQQYAAALAAALLIGLSKTGIAGAGILMVPLMAGQFPPAPSSGLMLPVLVAGDAFAVIWYRRSARWRYVLRTLPWAVAGIVAGYFFMRLCFGAGAIWPVSEVYLRRGIGVVILAMLVLGVAVKRPASHSPPPCPAPDGPIDPDKPDGPVQGQGDGGGAPGGIWFAPLIGGVAGFTTMVANAAGPVWIIYMLLLGLPVKEFLGTAGWAFLILNTFKLPFSAHLGYITAETLWFNVQMLPGLIVGCVLGVTVATRINQTWFNRLAVALTILAALNLLFANGE